MISYPKATVAFDFIIHVFRKKHQTNLKMEDIVVEVCGENRKIRGDGFLRGVHSSMFFRFDWQDLHRILWNTIKDLVMENKF